MSHYIHGSSPEEQHRLSLLNGLLNTSSLRELNLDQCNRIMDVGCGLGQFTRTLARAIDSKGFVLGIERDPQQMQ
jgi:precorrin-6B methylase 2